MTALSCFVFLYMGGFAVVRSRRSKRGAPGAVDAAFAVLCALLAAGTFGSALFISSATADEAAGWFRAFSFAWYLSPAVFLVFSLLLSGWAFRPLPAAAALVPGAAVALAQLVRPDAVLAAATPIPLGWHPAYSYASPWFWINAAASVAYPIASIAVLVRCAVTADRARRVKATIVLSSFVPTFLGAFFLGFAVRAFGVESLPPTLPIFLCILVVGLAVALSRYDLLELTPEAAAEPIFRSVRDAVVLVDPNGTVLQSNLGSWTPSARGDQAGLRAEELLPGVRDAAAWLESAASSSQGIEGRFAFVRGGDSPALLSVRPFDGRSGDRLGYVVAAHDLSTERNLRSLESRFSRAFAASPAGLIVLERPGFAFLDVNAAAAAMIGSSASSLVGTCAADLALQVNGRPIRDYLATLAPDDSAPNEEISLRRSDGSTIACLGSASPLDFGGGKAILITLVDVTEQFKLRRELMRAQKLESVGILAGGISHDFNNILTAVMGNVSLARLILDGRGEADEALTRAEAACERARTLSRQLLTFSRGGSHAAASADVFALAREAVQIATAGTGVTVSFSAEGPLPSASVDAAQISQAFGNIAVNAVQSMRADGVLRVRARTVSAASIRGEGSTVDLESLGSGDYVAIEFEDDGSGIAPELLGRIFDPYVTTKPNRSGLGLSISYSIVKRHGGAIVASSVLGEGSRFTVYLPALQAETGSPAGRTPDPGAFGTRIPAGPVLLMDDELAVRTTAERLLSKLGFAPTCCADGRAAAEAFRKARAAGRPFVAVILDLTVHGGMNGLDASSLIRAMDANVPVFLSSGYADGNDLADYAAYGFDGIISKPYGIEDLARRLTGSSTAPTTT